ncbi:hypothetical protein F5887DRAFT_349345 [Amanita rubescens]|nr:hypothetical protein F5887DRAFT_349345 [Amanita rubescens]
MNEGGQSSTGQLTEFILTTRPAYPQLVEQSKREDKPIHSVLEDILQRLRTEELQRRATYRIRPLLTWRASTL